MRSKTLVIAGIAALSVVAVIGGLTLWMGTATTLGPIVARLDGKATPPILRSADETMPSGNPVEAAARAIAQHDFRLIASGGIIGSVARPAGVICFTPDGIAPGIRAQFYYGDIITREVTEGLQYAQQFNRQIVAAESYPFADICRISTPEDASSYDAPLVDRSAREVARPVSTLHEAARRGSATDVRRFLATTPRNVRDEVGMTPLAWAAARSRSKIYDLLVFNGEEPRAVADPRGRDDLYWAIATGREAIVDKALRSAAPGSAVLGSIFLEAALASGNVAIAERVLAMPHRPLRKDMLRPQRWSAASVEVLLKASGNEVAQELLEASCNAYGEIRTDLVKLALRYGANPNVTPDIKAGRYKTPLYAVATSYGPSATEAMSILIAANADPNVAALDPPVHPEPPLWTIAGRLTWTDDAALRREMEIRVDMLIKAGARLDVLDRFERPPVWALIAPRSYAPDKIEPGKRAPDVVALFAARGMDVNAPWKGQRVLAAVEAQLGHQSPLAVKLRELGAKT